MKNIATYLLLGLIVVLTSCEKEHCYTCTTKTVRRYTYYEPDSVSTEKPVCGMKEREIQEHEKAGTYTRFLPAGEGEEYITTICIKR